MGIGTSLAHVVLFFIQSYVSSNVDERLGTLENQVKYLGVLTRKEGKMDLSYNYC